MRSVHKNRIGRLFQIVGVSFLLLAAKAWAGPPLLTDDPDTPGPNNWEINVAFTSEDEAGSWTLGTPLLDMNYGVGDTIQLKYQVPLGIYVPSGAGARVEMNNPLAGVKWRFIDQTNWSWLEVSMYPQYEFLLQESAIQRIQADNGNNLFLPIEVEHQWKSMLMYAEAGVILNSARPTEEFGGIAAEYELTENFSIMGEFYGGAGENFMENGLTFNVGFWRKLTKHAALIGSAGRALFGPAASTPSFQSYLGVQLTY